MDERQKAGSVRKGCWLKQDCGWVFLGQVCRLSLERKITLALGLIKAERTGVTWRNSKPEEKLKGQWSDDVHFYNEVGFHSFCEMVNNVGTIKALRKAREELVQTV
jgi:hypothetical protein